jgi:hypothetical protein
MNDVCEKRPDFFRREWCYLERNWYDMSVRGKQAREHFKEISREDCWCKDLGVQTPDPGPYRTYQPEWMDGGGREGRAKSSSSSSSVSASASASAAETIEVALTAVDGV